MAGRNRKNCAEYFSHDADASMDEKIIYLESVFGHTGYALYFKFLERMARSDGFKIQWNEIKKSIYASEFNVAVTELDRFVTESCRHEIEAFRIEDEMIFSPGLIKRMQPLMDKRAYNRQKYEEKKINNISHINNSSAEKAISADKKTQRKGKERKGKIYSDNSIEFVGSFINFVSDRFPKKAPVGKNVKDQSLKTIDLLMRKDGFSLEEIKAALRWAVEDDFWSTNVLSLASLRKKKDGLTKFQKIWADYERKNGASFGREARTPEFDKEAWIKEATS